MEIGDFYKENAANAFYRGRDSLTGLRCAKRATALTC